MRDLDVAPLALGANRVGFTDFALLQDRPHRARMVVDVYPVANAAPAAVKLWPAPCENVGDLAWDELLHMPIGLVVVRAAGDRGPNAAGSHPGAHEHIGRRFCGAIGTRGAVGSLFGEAPIAIEGQLAEDLIG